MNTKLWEMYKKSDEGKACIELFDRESENYDYENILKKFCTDEEDVARLVPWVETFFINNDEKEDFIPETLNFDSICDFIENYDLDDYDFDDDDNAISIGKALQADDDRSKKWLTIPMSLFLCEFFDFCKPMLYPSRFDIIQRNCNALDIELPPIPQTKNHLEYVLYYFNICSRWYEFQEEHNMTYAEFCACLYGFADMLCNDENVSQNPLPQPTNIWIAGGGGKNGDYQLLEDMCARKLKDNTSIWTCNEQTKRGDIIVMYVTSPYSCIHSIWRANSVGIFNPFDYYQSRTTICDGVKIPPISLNDLKDDEYFSNVSVVRQNLRGVNGKKFTAEDYEQLLRFIEQKGGKTDNLPKLFECEKVDFGKIKVEKDVEEKILIPILQKLGYNESDWVRQLSLKAGRKEKAIPDFVFFAQGKAHFETAPFVVEAKLDMSSSAERRNAFNQCFSYAKMLNAKIMGICDKERFVIYKVENGSASVDNPVFESNWNSVYNDEKTGLSLNKLIGRDVVKNM